MAGNKSLRALLAVLGITAAFSLRQGHVFGDMNDTLLGSAGAAIIRGVVISDDPRAPQPIALATLGLTQTGTTDGPTRTAVADDSGRFEFNSISPGRYLLSATKAGYVSAAFGASRPRQAGTAIVVADGQELNDLRIILHRTAVITGSVLASNGRPAAGVMVAALQARMGLNGARRFERLSEASESGVQSHVVTDHAGQFRLYGLSPGRYGLRAHWLDETTTPATFLAVYYPSALDPSAAQIITLEAGEERAATLVLQPVATSRVQGTVAAPGVSADRIRLAIDQREPSESFLNEAFADPSGSFAFHGVRAGTYVIQARSQPKAATREILWGQASVSVTGQDVSGVVVTLVPGRTLSGRIELEPSSSAHDPSRAQIRLEALYPWQRDQPLNARVDRTGKFFVGGVVPGRYRLMASMPQATGAIPWRVRSISVNGRELTESFLEVGPEDQLSDVIIAITTLQQEITGTLTRTDMQPATDLTVVLFPADRRLWSDSTTRIRAVRPATDAQFAAPDLPAGEYFVAALMDPDPDDLVDANFLDVLAQSSVRVTVAPGERKVLHLQVAPGR